MNLLITQNSQNLQHTHTFTGSAVNTDEKGGHSHNTNSLKDKDTGLNKTNTGPMSGNSTGTIQAVHSYNGYYEPWQNATGCFSISGGNGGMAWNAETIGDIRNNDKLTINVAHTHNMEHTHGTDTKGAHTHSVTAAGTNSNNGGTEVRPVDYTYKIWKRTA